MSIHFDPILPMTTVAPIIVGLAVLVLYGYRRYAPIVSRPYWWCLLLTKLLSLAAILALLANPYWLHSAPDASRLRVLVLADGTGSMNTRDCDDASRIDIVVNRLLTPASAAQRAIAALSTAPEYYLFAGNDLRRFDPANGFGSVPGETDIDGALLQAQTAPVEGRQVAAVVLITDGIDNIGAGAMEAARAYREQQIPIHCIGVGDPSPHQDFAVHWLQPPASGTKGQPLTLTARLKRNFASAALSRATLYEDGRPIETQEPRFSDDKREIDLTFTHTPTTGGFKTYKIELAPGSDEDNLVNNVDFAGVTVADPAAFRMFMFNANLDWEYKFLNGLAEEEEKLIFDAAIRLGDSNFFVRGADDGQTTMDGLPDCERIHPYDCLLIHLNSLYLLSSEQLDCLAHYVEHRGGGIVFAGVATEIPESIRQILPIKSAPTNIVRPPLQPLVFQPSRIMTAVNDDDWQRLQDGLFFPEDSEALDIPPEILKPGAATVISLASPSLPVLIVHQYGAGKVALLNLGDTWKWVMQRDNGEELHALFWGRVISWMASSGKARISVNPGSKKVTVLGQLPVFAEVLNEQYLPDHGAIVTATAIDPTGQESPLHFIPDPRVEGRHRATFIPRVQGHYRLYVKVKMSNGEVRAEEREYIAVDNRPESEPAALAEGVLQSLARQTGGTYWHYRDADSIQNLTTAKTLHHVEVKIRWLESWWFLLALLAAMVPDWALRRRIGLR